MGKLVSSRNQVLIKRKYKNEDQKTEAGILVVADTSFRPALHADRIAEVILVPDSLYYHSKEMNYGPEPMPWLCDLEIKPGDTVVHTFMERDDIVNIEVDDEPGELYRLMPYDDIYVARRGEEIIPLNGYNLCEEVDKPKISKLLDLVHEEPVDRMIGKVVHAAKPNREYRLWNRATKRWYGKDLDGEAMLSPGDIIIKRRGDIHIRLEEDIHARFFDSEVMYFIIQQKDIMAIR